MSLARILVVDDEQVVLDSVRKLLRHEDYEIETVLSAPDALAKLGGFEADVILTDLMMPAMDGLEFLVALRKAGHEQPVIMITGYATMRTALEALRKGAFDYIAKPFTRKELSGVVSRAVRQAGRAGAAESAAPVRDAAGPDVYRHLGGHCWVRVMEDRSARVGLSSDFAATVGAAEGLELPAVGDYVEQGSVCVRILTTDGRTHTLWSPLSGSILEVNSLVAERPGLVVEDPFETGWLIRIDPGNLEQELKGLSMD